MARNHVQPGRVLDYTNTGSSPVVSGQVVLAGVLLGVALGDIAPGAAGSVQIDGVFDVPKVAGIAIAQGAAVIFKTADGAFTVGEAAAGDLSGASAVAFAAATAAATTVHIKFTGVPGTIAGE